jgi:type IV pilus assembly protein PilO
MTAGDFIPPDQDFEVAPNYPTAFGITFTPMVTGITCGVVGLLAAIYLWMTLGQPAFDENTTLRETLAKKEKELDDQKDLDKQLKDAKARLANVEQQRQQVLSLFAEKKDLNTILFDLNQLIDKNNAGLVGKRQQKLNICPSWVRDQYTSIASTQQFEERTGPLVAEARLEKFEPVNSSAPNAGTPPSPVPGVVNDGSLGKELDNKLKRETIQVTFEGNFAQTQSIFRTIERLQPFLILKGLEVRRGRAKQAGNDNQMGGLYEIQADGLPKFLTNCQPDAILTTSFKMDALLPLTEEEAKLLQPAATPSPGATPSPQ